jgi:hypothetical protein
VLDAQRTANEAELAFVRNRQARLTFSVDLMRALAPRLPSGLVPRVLFEDRENYLFAMEAVAADHVVWKAELLAGTCDVRVAARLGDCLMDRVGPVVSDRWPRRRAARSSRKPSCSFPFVSTAAHPPMQDTKQEACQIAEMAELRGFRLARAIRPEMSGAALWEYGPTIGKRLARAAPADAMIARDVRMVPMFALAMGR